MLKEYTWSRSYERENFSKEEVLKILNNDESNAQNTSIKILNKNVCVETLDRGSIFIVSEFKDGNKYSLISKSGYRKLDDKESFSELVENFSYEKLADFDIDKSYSLKQFIKVLSEKEKDELLYKLLNK